MVSLMTRWVVSNDDVQEGKKWWTREQHLIPQFLPHKCPFWTHRYIRFIWFHRWISTGSWVNRAGPWARASRYTAAFCLLTLGCWNKHVCVTSARAVPPQSWVFPELSRVRQEMSVVTVLMRGAQGWRDQMEECDSRQRRAVLHGR